MGPRTTARLLAVAAGVLLATGCGPRQPWMRDESDRIAVEMTPEPYTDQTPGAEGIHLGDDAPPLAKPFTREDSMLGRRQEHYVGDTVGIARTVPATGACCRNHGHGIRPKFIYKGNGLLP